MVTRFALICAFSLVCAVLALADVYEVEPNDTFPGNHIGMIANGEAVVGRIYPMGDWDFHYFDTAANGLTQLPVLRRYTFDVHAVSVVGIGDSRLWIYDTGPDGWFLASNDDRPNSTDGSSLAWFDLFDFGGVNTWGYWMRGLDPSPNSDVSHKFDYEMTVAWEEIDVLDGGTYLPGPLNINTALSNYNTELAVFDRMGTLIGQDDDGGPGTTSSLDVALEAGTYYIMTGGFDTRLPGDVYPGSWDRSGAGLGGLYGTRGGNLELDIGGNRVSTVLHSNERLWLSIRVAPEPGFPAAVAFGPAILAALGRWRGRTPRARRTG